MNKREGGKIELTFKLFSAAFTTIHIGTIATRIILLLLMLHCYTATYAIIIDGNGDDVQ